MSHSEEYGVLETRLGYGFENRDRLVLALTHSSFSNELQSGDPKHTLCNERLEFLGDSVLQLISGEYLFTDFSERPEGELTKLRAFAVCEDALCDYAREIGLGAFLRLGKGEDATNGRERKSILADAFEALIAAIYLDAGERGLDPLATVRAFVVPFLGKRISMTKRGTVTSDYKTALQQIVQSVDGERLEYVTVAEKGPDHRKIFEVEARLTGNVIGKGRGSSRREAEQAAAKEALKLFGEI
ncbi:MAG: ribonuclease III [Ruminococcaceae bacterium]|nr:ribonuclease III [Oscillospiraceae bacterium]